jgi:hypothetical protein
MSNVSRHTAHMTPEQLLALLRNPEDGFTERKPEGAKRDEIRRTLVAFANSVPEDRTAVLFVGLHDGGAVLGVKATDSEQKRIREIAERHCYPPIPISSEVLSVEGTNVLAVQVHHSRKRPHFAGPAYVRRGSESVAASDELYEDLINSRTDKCRSILRWKGLIITVLSEQHVLGKSKYIADVHQRDESECRVVACDSHTLTLEVINSSRQATEPLDRVSISFDDSRRRPMLVVRGT